MNRSHFEKNNEVTEKAIETLQGNGPIDAWTTLERIQKISIWRIICISATGMSNIQLIPIDRIEIVQ